MKEGRIPCLNRKCRRTAPAEKYGPGYEIICAKCWKLLPKELCDRYRILKRYATKIERLAKKRLAQGSITEETVAVIKRRLDMRQRTLWLTIRAHFIAPTKPEGLDAFLEELGWKD